MRVHAPAMGAAGVTESAAGEEVPTVAGRSRGSGGSQSGSSGGGDTKGGTPRARRTSARAERAGTRPKPKPDTSSIAEPTVTATDEVLAASNAQRALSPDMPRVAWLRTQLQNLEAQRAERLVKIVQLTLIAVVFAIFVLQNADPVDVNLLIFSLNIRLIWVIFGCAALGGVAGYLIGRPEKSLRDLLPQKEKKPSRAGRRTAGS